MKTRVVLGSYAIMVVSGAAILTGGFLSQSYYGYGFSWFFGLGLPGAFVAVFAVAGMVLGPYFGLAGFTAKNGSVWAETNRMLQAHISFPILGGLLLFWSSIIPYALEAVLPIYVVFVLLGTLISVMASKKTAPSFKANASISDKSQETQPPGS